MRKSENSLFPIISNREDFYKMFIIETSFSFGFKSTELDIGQGKKKKKKEITNRSFYTRSSYQYWMPFKNSTVESP